MTLQYLNWTDKEERDRLCSGLSFVDGLQQMNKGKCLQITEGRLRLDVRKRCFTIRVVRHWHRLRRKVTDAPVLVTFKIRLDEALSNVF